MTFLNDTQNVCCIPPQLALVDVLHAAPDLLPCYLLSAFPTHGQGIRILRQVSKEVGCLALEAVTTCTVDLACTSRLCGMVRLLKRAKLLDLKVTVTTAQGG